MIPAPYENQYIGIFIYALGYRKGQLSPNENIETSINLFQQTKADATYADLLYNSDGRGLLIEFKRSWENIPDEFTKTTKLKFHKFLKEPGNEDFRNMSDACHYMAWGEPVSTLSGTFTLNFSSYVKAASNPRDLNGQALSSYIEAIIRGQAGLPMDDFRTYLSYLRQLSGGGSSGGLIVTVNKNGQIQAVAVPEIGNLQMQVRTRESTQERAIENTRAKSRGGISR